MRASELAERLKEMVAKYGDGEVKILTESDLGCVNCAGTQVEQELGDVAYSAAQREYKLLPTGF